MELDLLLYISKTNPSVDLRTCGITSNFDLLQSDVVLGDLCTSMGCTCLFHMVREISDKLKSQVARSQ